MTNMAEIIQKQDSRSKNCQHKWIMTQHNKEHYQVILSSFLPIPFIEG